MSDKADHIDKILHQWQSNHSLMETSLPLAIIGRSTRLNKSLENARTPIYKELKVTMGEFDVLATLYRNGAPFQLTPSDLIRQTLLTSGAMTNRLDKLEAKGLIHRIHSEQDRRSIVVGLTAKGIELIDEGIKKYFTKVDELCSPLTNDEQTQLNSLLKKWISHLG
ncbi:MarR family transcriptional regulator [Vibrio inusitatus NBRC 102082]|uniref:MarR family transcriptional regulator n=1 Tax=Vibrio inusitatus NBRC 102082 TaxID=1219070 RepID=A0A4Y3I0E9_9VIBR|nr:MarR family transcriptional regulator [Vibrio inusitatus]GEA52715.1 MarR family transcriptional regulator [Vibrio inusitatus NBRC 102082]